MEVEGSFVTLLVVCVGVSVSQVSIQWSTGVRVLTRIDEHADESSRLRGLTEHQVLVNIHQHHNSGIKNLRNR